MNMPDDIRGTIRKSLLKNRMRPLSLTHWDYEHTRKVDAALEWLEQQEEAQPHTIHWTGPSGRVWKVDIETKQGEE